MRRVSLLVASLSACLALIGCSALQPTKNADGSQTASPAGKEVLKAADAGEAALQGASSLPGIFGLVAGVGALLGAYGVKRLHDKLDDITPETPVIATAPATRPTG